MSMTIEQFNQALNASVGSKLQMIIDRGSDTCFTPREEETFSMLIDFIKDKNNSITDRARACYHHDLLMGVTDGITELWMKAGEQAVVDDFINSVEGI